MLVNAQVLRRVALGVWLMACLLGALNHTVAEALFGTQMGLPLPNQRYGYVMFNRTPRVIQITTVVESDGREDFIDILVVTPSPFYKRARWSLNLLLEPTLLSDICRQAKRDEPVTFVTRKYAIASKNRAPLQTRRLLCQPDGRLVRAPRKSGDAP